MEVQSTSIQLSELARVALAALSDSSYLKGKEMEIAALLARASESCVGTNLAVAQHVQKLLDSATKN